MQMSQNLQNFVNFQKCQLENLVDFEKCCKTHIYLQNRSRYSRKRATFCRNFANGSAADLGLTSASRPASQHVVQALLQRLLDAVGTCRSTSPPLGAELRGFQDATKKIPVTYQTAGVSKYCNGLPVFIESF